MKVRFTSKEQNGTIGESGLIGKALVVEEDQVGYTCYDVVLEAGVNQDIKSAFGNNHNHIYYCIYGEITFQVTEGTTETLKTDHVIALTGAMQAKVIVNSKTRLFITYTKESDGSPQPQKAFHDSLDKIVGTERDVDWGRGRSRRYMREAEGFGVSVHNTLCDPEKSSTVQFPNHKETVYDIEGDIEYVWDDGKNSQAFYQVDRRSGDGFCITMDKNEAHTLKAKSLPCIMLCVFYPALKGTETHDFTKKVSSY